jgi:hypothetical protein
LQTNRSFAFFAEKKMRKLLPATLILTLLLFTALQAFPQEKTSPYKLSVSGFLRADAIFDNRQVVEAREGFLLFFPQKPEYDKDGKDIHAHPSFNQYAMTSRLTAKASGPDVLGAKVLGLIEADFTGASNSENNSLRLRHAYISLQWDKTRLLVGQYWHPLDVPEMIPNVLSLNTGAPFHSFSRQPQVRIDYKSGHFNLVAVASSQRDYTNQGPSGSSSIYLRNSVGPNLHGQLQYKNEGLFAGAGIDFKQLTPALVTDSTYIGNVHLNCLSYTAFLSFTQKNLNIKTQYTLGRALNDHLMMGGFGTILPGENQNNIGYTALTHHYIWMNAAYTLNKWQPSLFLGYLTNAGADKTISGPVYARGADIDYLYRVSPMITYTTGKLSIMAEMEYTVAAYGDVTDTYAVVNTTETGNFRLGLGMVYGF